VPNRPLIGKGTWMDKVAYQVLERERRLGRSLELVRVESGLGASGIPHIGNLSDTIRAYGIEMALEVQGVKSEHIAYIDDMDGLRKVPQGIPESANLERYIAQPVSRIPDPFGCHSSYGEHMGSLLREGMDKVGIEYTYQSASENYRKGIFVPFMKKILLNSEAIGRKIKEITGQEKYEASLPYFPVCPNCRRIYTTQALHYDDSTEQVHFKCVGTTLRGKFNTGCGYEGDTKISSGEGKLSWKVEFATRWAALDIRYEAYGKELTNSVKVNDWVSEAVLDFPHPYHVKYELFLDKAGKKFSKSEGALLTPQTWFRYATGSSLALLMFKRIVGTRSISIDDIPKYMDELDWLEDVYLGKEKVEPLDKAERLKGLYEYVTFLHPKPSQFHVPYRLLADIARAAPEEKFLDYVVKRLKALGYPVELTPEVKERIRLARNWGLDVLGSVETERTEQLNIPEEVRIGISELAHKILDASGPDEIQSMIFQIAKEKGVPASEFFRYLYRIILSQDRGPKLGPYIFDAGVNRVSKMLLNAVQR
jgi:lysyl-tRNA synthetase class 1